MRDCRLRFTAPTSLRIELTQNSLTQHFVLRLFFSCSSAQESTRFARSIQILFEKGILCFFAEGKKEFVMTYIKGLYIFG